MNSWKQPTPTDINDNPNLTAVERAVFREILSLCQNHDTLFHFIHAQRHYSIELERGQCVFKVASFAHDFQISRKKINRSLKIISKWYTELNIKGMPFGCIVTIKNYDQIVKMDNKKDNNGTIKGQKRDNKGTTNKSVEILESVEIYPDKKNKSSEKKNKRKEEMNSKAVDFLKGFNDLYGTSYTSTRGIVSNLAYWLEDYSMVDILLAVENSKNDFFWSAKLTPTILLRRKNQRGEDVDYIGELLNRSSQNVPPAPSDGLAARMEKHAKRGEDP